MGGGKGGGGGGFAGSEEVGNLLTSGLMGAALTRAPWMRAAFGPGTQLGASYAKRFPGAALPEGMSRPPAYGPTTQGAHRMLFGGQQPNFQTQQPGGKGGGASQSGFNTLRSPTGMTPTAQSAPSGKSGSGATGSTTGGLANASFPGSFRGAGNLVPVPGGRMSQDEMPSVLRTEDIAQLMMARRNPMGGASAYKSIIDNMKERAEQYEQDGGIPAKSGQYRGSGQLSPLPGSTTPTFTPPPMTQQNYALPSMPGYTPPVAAQAQQTAAIQPLSIPQQKFQMAGQMGTEQIGQGARQAQQDVMRQYAARGLGRSGLALGAAANAYQQGAGRQIADLARSLAGERMGMEFGEAQTARGLEAQRQQQTVSNQQNAEASALARALGLGNLGISERAQGVSEQGQELAAQNALLQALTGLTQSQIAASASQGGGKGK